MEQIDYELKILELEQRNKFLRTEYSWVWKLYRELREKVSVNV